MTEKVRALAKELMKYRRKVNRRKLTKDEKYHLLKTFVSRVQVNFVIDADDEELCEEACLRGLRSLPFCNDDDLLTEADRRGLSTVRFNLSDRDFEREARKRGFRRRLADFPKSEIQAYLRIQKMN